MFHVHYEHNDCMYQYLIRSEVLATNTFWLKNEHGSV